MDICSTISMMLKNVAYLKYNVGGLTYMNKNMFVSITFFVFSIAMLFSGCVKKNIETETALSGSLQMTGSSSMQEVCDKLANDFMKKYPKIDVVKSGTGSGEAPRVVKDGIAQIGDISRDLTDEENPEYFDKYNIAIDGIAICVNKENDIKNLSMNQISEIFAGKIQNWSEVGGREGLITVVGRDAASGTRTDFEKAINVTSTCQYSVELDSSGKVKEKVKSDPNAIGYISFSGMDDFVNVVNVDGVEPTDENILNGSYKLSRFFIQIVRKQTCDELVKAWFDYIYSDEGRELVKKAKLIPVSR